MQTAKSNDSSHALLRDDDIYNQYSQRTAIRLRTENSWFHDNVLRTSGGNTVVIGSDEIMPDGSIAKGGHTVVDHDENGKLMVKLSAAERSSVVDVAAAMNRGAYSVVQNTPLSKAYLLFTALGLRTLPVLGQNGCVVGIISRSNLLPEYMELRTGLRMQ